MTRLRTSPWPSMIARAQEFPERMADLGLLIRAWEFQGPLYERLVLDPPLGKLDLTIPHFARRAEPDLRQFLSVIQSGTYPKFRDAVEALMKRSPERLAELAFGTQAQPEGEVSFISRLFRQVIVRSAVDALGISVPPDEDSGQCPCCEGKPQLSFVKVSPDKGIPERNLVCATCLRDWRFPNELCPECQESDLEKRPRFNDESGVGMEALACETCMTYLICVDLDRRPGAIPLVDELLTSSLDVLVRDQGYVKIELNLLGS